MLAALSAVVLFAGHVTGIMDLTAIAAAALLSAISVVELGGVYPYLIWAAVSVISFMTVPGEVASGYLLFGGIYPILKLYFERLPRVLEWVAKLCYGAVVLGTLWALTKFLFDGFDEPKFVMIGLGVGYALFFVLFDYALSVAITLYMRRLRPKLSFLRRL